ncbi:MAG TPA: two-component regulator propeller domain-containing protein, partial [Chitinophagaceae bacterium]|nr:two-component regulator propeller domain-containing protein [Chitinophagaceae bacterium]
MYALFAFMFSCQGEVSQQGEPELFFISRRAKGDTVQNLGKNIMVIYQDSKNNYWFGSWEDGLYKFNGNTLIHFTQKDGLPSNRIEEIKEDKLGNLYFNTSQGLCKFNGSQFDVLAELANSENEWKLQSDDLWFKGTRGGGHTFRYDGKNLFKLKLPSTKLGDDYMSKFSTGTNPYDVYCVYMDHQGNVWFGTAVLGVCRFNGKSFDWISTSDVNEMHNGPSNGVRSIIEDGAGDFWFNTAFRYRMINS